MRETLEIGPSVAPSLLSVNTYVNYLGGVVERDSVSVLGGQGLLEASNYGKYSLAKAPAGGDNLVTSWMLVYLGLRWC